MKTLTNQAACMVLSLAFFSACGGVDEFGNLESQEANLFANPSITKNSIRNRKATDDYLGDRRVEDAKGKNEASRGRSLGGPTGNINEENIPQRGDIDPQGEGDPQTGDTDCEESEFNDCAEIDRDRGDIDPSEEDDVPNEVDCQDNDLVDCDPTDDIRQDGDRDPEEEEGLDSAYICGMDQFGELHACQDIADEANPSTWDRDVSCTDLNNVLAIWNAAETLTMPLCNATNVANILLSLNGVDVVVPCGPDVSTTIAAKACGVGEAHVIAYINNIDKAINADKNHGGPGLTEASCPGGICPPQDNTNQDD